METSTIWTAILWGLFLLNFIGIFQEIRDAVQGNGGKVLGGIILGIGLGTWAFVRAKIRFAFFPDPLDSAVFCAIILVMLWALLSWLYCRWKY